MSHTAEPAVSLDGATPAALTADPNGTPPIVQQLSSRARAWRLAECLLLFGGVPLTLALLPTGTIRPLSLIGTITLTLLLLLFLDKSFDRSVFTRVRGLGRTFLRSILPIYLVGSLGMLLFIWLTYPQALFSLPRNRPDIWALVMIFYPIFSVVPQSIIYRAFFVHRYAPIFGRGTLMIVVGALFFSLGHLLFHSWIALGMTFIGGLLFTWRYLNTRSLITVTLEHALYGQMAFTLGYGLFLYHASLRIVQDNVTP